MTILHIFSKFRQKSEPIGDTINRIKNGEPLLKNDLIRDYKPFIIKVVSKATGKYVDLENSDEFSIALIAFDEAIDCYDVNKNTNFFSFAEIIIKRRLIDDLRKNYKDRKVYPLTYFDNSDEDDRNIFEEKYFKLDASSIFNNIETKEEIVNFSMRLKKFNIEIADLVKCAPKHMDSKRLAIKIARLIAENKDLSEKLETKKTMPVVDLLKLINVNHKTIERNRKFIIAVYLILSSNLEVMQGYVNNVERGEHEHA